MDFEQINTFLTIVRTRSISAAADQLYLSQFAVGARLQRLEKELGVLLLGRAKGQREINLTKEGEEFIFIAEKWLNLYQESQMLHTTRSQKPLRIDGIESICNYDLAPFWREFALTHTDSRLSIFINHSNKILQDIENYEADVGFVGYSSDYPNIVFEPLFQEEFKLIIYSPPFSPEIDVDPRMLSPAFEIYKSWGNEFDQWHSSWWGNDAEQRLFTLTDISLLSNIMVRDGVWSVVPTNIAKGVQKISSKIRICNLRYPAPTRICYKATHRRPLPSVADNLNAFSVALEDYLRRISLSEAE